METVQNAITHFIQTVLRSVDPSDVASIAVAGQGDGFWGLDTELKHAHNAILQNDQRAADIASRWTENSGFEVLGAPISSSAKDKYGIRRGVLLGAATTGYRDQYSSMTANGDMKAHLSNESLATLYNSSDAKFRASIDIVKPTW